MKVITIKQPWATLIAKGYKEYEFRTWKTKYRGEILIHAGKGIDKKAMARFENLKLEEISEIIKIKQRTYSGYETGRSQTPLYVLYLLARTYNISLDYLIGRSENKIRKENNYGFRKR